MASKNETVAEIVREMRGPYYKMGRSNASLDKQMMDYMSFIANRIESAHKRELAAKDDARLTIVANYETVIAAKDAEIAKLRTLTTHTDNSEVIAELQRRLKAAEKFATEMKQTMNSLVRACGHQIILRLQGEGGNNEGK